jgi:hypothetical protein
LISTWTADVTPLWCYEEGWKSEEEYDECSYGDNAHNQPETVDVLRRHTKIHRDYLLQPETRRKAARCRCDNMAAVPEIPGFYYGTSGGC